MVLLALPAPAPSFKMGVGFVITLLVPLILMGACLLPFIEHMHFVGVLLTGLFLYHGFYFTARGGSPILGMFFVLGLSMIVTIGSVTIDAIFMLIPGLGLGAIFGFVFVWVAHACLPDYPSAAPNAAAPPPEPSPRSARRNAMRSTLIVFPLAVIFLFSAASASYMAVMIKVATMGQQTNVEVTRNMGRAQLESTLWGGVGAIVGWQILSFWPSLYMYTLFVTLCGLLYGAQIFRGKGLSSNASMWSYAFVTMIILLAPAVTDSQSGSAAGAAFWSRLGLFIVIALYGSLTAVLFNAFWKAPTPIEEHGDLI